MNTYFTHSQESFIRLTYFFKTLEALDLLHSFETTYTQNECGDIAYLLVKA